MATLVQSVMISHGDRVTIEVRHVVQSGNGDVVEELHLLGRVRRQGILPGATLVVSSASCDYS